MEGPTRSPHAQRQDPRALHSGGPDAPAPWDAFGASSARPLTPPFGGSPQHDGSRPRTALVRAATATPPAAKPGVLRSVRTNANLLTGLLKRPGTAAPASATGSPFLELRGAGLMPPEPPLPAAPSPGAAPHSHAQPQPHKMALPPTCHLHERAGSRSSPTLLRPASAVVAAHGLDLCSPVPASSALQPHRQQPRPGTAGRAAAAAPPPPAAHQQQQQQHSVAASASSSLTDGSSSLPSEYGSQGAGPTTMHQNPLYAGGSESFARQAAPQPARGLPAVRVPTAAAAGTATPVTPPSAAQLGLSPTGTPLGHLQAASNLTVASDRPISPGPFLSGLPSGALPGDSHCSTRPVSPQCMDSAPPTPGSFAPAGLAAVAATVAAASRGPGLSPIRTVSSAAATVAPQSRSLPTSPAPPAAAAAASGACMSPVAAAGVAASFRVPIFNADGRLVGYKQNSNLIPRPGPCISSAPSSPSRSAFLADAATYQTTSFSADQGASPPPPAKPAAPPPLPPSDEEDFREAAADPCMGFPDADNMVPGYLLGPVLGKGGFCSVRKARHGLTGRSVACKIIEKGKLKDPKDRDRVDRECRVMRNLSNHVGVIKLYEYVETRDYVYIMMEAAQRGSLLDYVRERKRLPEGEAVQVLQQLLHVLQFCHRKDVVHRDIKLENILIDAAGHMKLIDFGLCGYYVAGKRLRCHCGSPSYAAPEIVARKDYLGPPVDVWSLGIVLFAALAGYLPFHAKDKKALSEKILAGVYKPAAWMSAEVQDLLSQMLTLDPEQRITLDRVWAHPWVASAPRWQPPGVGAGRLYRALTDPTTGAVLPDEAVMAQLEGLGADTAAIRRALRSRECNSLTAAYHLELEAALEAARAAAAHEAEAAATRAAAAKAAAAERAAASATDWKWDFAAISTAGDRSSGSTHASVASSSGAASIPASTGSGSSSLRGSGSPARPRTAAGTPTASPTRFGQEAVAAGYLSPRQMPGAGAAPHASAAPASPLAFRRQPQQQAAGEAQQAAAGQLGSQPPSEPFTIMAVHPPLELAAADLVAGAHITASAVTATTALVTAEAPAPKHFAPLPTALSPKQLVGVSSPGGAAGAGDHSPPMARVA